MNKWKEVKLQELVFFQRGFDITKDKQVEGEIPVISSSGITSYHNQYMVKGPGVVIGRKGSLGTIYFINSNYWPHDTTLWSKNFNGNDPKYAYYFLHTFDFKNFNVGGANPTLNRNHIHDLRIPLPPLATQKRIASILSAYDDLIENNRRRITLLEESAKLLYKEWFVRFKFPGHEKVKIKNGIPEGWERKKLGEVVEFKYGKSLKAEEREPGDYNVYGSSGIVGTHTNYLVSAPSIIIGRKGNVGSIFLSLKNFYPIDTVYYIPTEQFNYFLYLSLMNIQFQNNDGAVPGLNREAALKKEILYPKEMIRKTFEEKIEPIFLQKETLTFQNQKLREARDILLPKLMSGKIEV